MAQFVELEDGSLVNLDHVVKLSNQRLNRLEFITGGHIQLAERDAARVRGHIADLQSTKVANTRALVFEEPIAVEPEPDPIPKEEMAPNPKRRGRPPKKKTEVT